MKFIDTHCHVHFDNYPLDKETTLANAGKAGVVRMITVGTTVADSAQAIAFASQHDNVWASAGVHPHEATQFLASPGSKDNLAKLLNKSSIIAVGEIGLDYYKNYSPKEEQIELFKMVLAMSKDLGLPYIFHVRDAWEDFWRIFDENDGLTGVVHSFSSGTKQLKNVLDRGLMVGLNGIMTFTKDESQLLAARQVPLERLLLETDAPFLTPMPFRGEVCEPKHVRSTAEFLAGLRGDSLEAIASATTANAERLFNLKKA